MNTPYDWEIHFLRGRRQAYNHSIQQMEEVIRNLRYQEVRVDVELERLEMAQDEFITNQSRVDIEKGDGRRIDRESETMPIVPEESWQETLEQEGETLVEEGQTMVDEQPVTGLGFGKFDETADNDPTRDAVATLQDSSKEQIEANSKAGASFNQANQQGGKWAAKEEEVNRDKSNDR